MTEWAWGRGLIEKYRAHVREIHDGRPVSHRVGGVTVGFALCGAWLVGDAEPDSGRFLVCSRCRDLMVEIDLGEADPPGWSADE